MRTYTATIWFGRYSFSEYITAEDCESACISAELGYPSADMIVCEAKYLT